ncbi:MAG: hypothetical protein M0Q26_14970 [Chitinophagaceae bacterium]|nr:hypothetical protein [Chitinophagaceae bacterium]
MPGRQYSAISEGPQWKMVVGRDAIVLVINSRNPFLNEIVRQGISAEEFSQIIKNPDKVKRGEHILTIIQKGKRLIISAPLSGFI